MFASNHLFFLVKAFISTGFVLYAVAVKEVSNLSDMCIAKGLPSYDETVARELASISNSLLIDNQFGLFSHIYSVSPAVGSPILFKSNGDVESVQFNKARWFIQGKKLILEQGQQQTVFVYHGECGVLATPIQAGEDSLLLELSIVANPIEEDLQK